MNIKQLGVVIISVCSLFACSVPQKYVLVDKSDRKMYVKKGGRTLQEFTIALGKKPVGHKIREGDQRTPEGVYRLDYKNTQSLFYKSIHISYPNTKDRIRASKLGVKPGGAIVVHGLPNGRSKAETIARRGKDWTDGCIALSNKDMDRFWHLIDRPGTLIKIKP